MGRPAKFDRESAVETVMQEIWREGFERASVKALSERLGITRSSFYNAFGSREALFEKVLERYFDQSPDRPLREAGPQTPIRPLLTSVFREICRARAGDDQARGCLVVNGVADRCRGDMVVDHLASLLAEALLGSLARIRQLLDWAQARGEIAPGADTEALALAVQNLLAGLSVVSKVERNEARLWAGTALTLKGLGLYGENGGEGHAQS